MEFLTYTTAARNMFPSFYANFNGEKTDNYDKEFKYKKNNLHGWKNNDIWKLENKGPGKLIHCVNSFPRLDAFWRICSNQPFLQILW